MSGTGRRAAGTIASKQNQQNSAVHRRRRADPGGRLTLGATIRTMVGRRDLFSESLSWGRRAHLEN
jgi:hypothetical protein